MDENECPIGDWKFYINFIKMITNQLLSNFVSEPTSTISIADMSLCPIALDIIKRKKISVNH